MAREVKQHVVAGLQCRDAAREKDCEARSGGRFSLGVRIADMHPSVPGIWCGFFFSNLEAIAVARAGFAAMEPAVLDSGSLYLRAGFASPDQDPSVVCILISPIWLGCGFLDFVFFFNSFVNIEWSCALLPADVCVVEVVRVENDGVTKVYHAIEMGLLIDCELCAFFKHSLGSTTVSTRHRKLSLNGISLGSISLFECRSGKYQ